MTAVALKLDQAGNAVVPLQTFAHEADRARLSPVAVKAFVGVAKAWKLSNRDAADLMAVSGSTYDRLKRGEPIILNQDQLTRASALIGIYKGLHLMFADAMADDWPLLANSGPLFGGHSPVNTMRAGGIPKMLDTRRYIDAVRGGI